MVVYRECEIVAIQNQGGIGAPIGVRRENKSRYAMDAHMSFTEHRRLAAAYSPAPPRRLTPAASPWTDHGCPKGS